jgi:hypothetical protein
MKLDTKPQFLYSLSNKNCVFISFNSERNFFPIDLIIRNPGKKIQRNDY